MSVMFYWKGDNYLSDMREGKSYQLNQDSKLIIDLKPNEHIWAFTRLDGPYVLAADLVVLKTQYNSPGYIYGKYCAIGDTQRSRYFNVYKAIDVEPVIRKIYPQAPSINIIGKRFELGSFFEGPSSGVRLLDPGKEQLLISFVRVLSII